MSVKRFKTDLQRLSKSGKILEIAMRAECFPELKKQLDGIKGGDGRSLPVPSFSEDYQAWYSESLALVRHALPDRLADFVRLYEKQKGRRELTNENYSIEDYLQGLSVSNGIGKTVVGPSAAISKFAQQVAIVRAAAGRFDSSLYDVKQIVQADLLDSELEAADVLRKSKFLRAAGAVAGVVLERHLSEVCASRGLTTSKKNPGIAEFNELLKTASCIDTSQWRFNQHLGDIRNLCDHDRKKEPTPEQVTDLIDGVRKVTKTIQ